ncbi:MAG TPA: class I SAM-dependent methyltransferase [Terracidiphilus sp.]|nr:class I SAM-dependent methyltransferase [Terracidiphilus sp.]
MLSHEISEQQLSAVAQVSTAQCIGCSNEQPEPFLAAPDRFHGRKHTYQLMRCPSCSLVWLKDPPAPESMGEHYGPDYDRWVAAAGDAPERWSGRVKTIARYRTGGTLLDLGCSSGGFLQAMKSPHWNLYGIEMSDVVARYAESVSGAKVFVGDILEAPFAPASFDVITCFHVFEHLYQPLAVLKKVAEWLKPGGIFYFMVPNIDSAGERIFRSYWYALELPRHLFHFSPRSLQKLAERSGLEQVSLEMHREIFFEKSIRYYLDDKLEHAGFSRAPLAKDRTPGILIRVVRKGFRLTILPVLGWIAALAGDGESIHAVLRKPPL